MSVWRQVKHVYDTLTKYQHNFLDLNSKQKEMILLFFNFFGESGKNAYEIQIRYF